MINAIGIALNASVVQDTVESILLPPPRNSHSIPLVPQLAIFLTAPPSAHHDRKYHATGTLRTQEGPLILIHIAPRLPRLFTMRDQAVDTIHDMMLEMLGSMGVIIVAIQDHLKGCAIR